MVGSQLQNVGKWARQALEFGKNKTEPNPWIKGSSDPRHFIFEINVGKSRIRYKMSLKLNDELLDRLKIDWSWRHLNS